QIRMTGSSMEPFSTIFKLVTYGCLMKSSIVWKHSQANIPVNERPNTHHSRNFILKLSGEFRDFRDKQPLTQFIFVICRSSFLWTLSNKLHKSLKPADVYFR